MFDRYRIPEDELGPQFINEILASIDGVDYVFLIKEADEHTHKLSFRARRDGFDVSNLARKFGGGGHASSAGAYTDLPATKIIKIIEETELFHLE